MSYSYKLKEEKNYKDVKFDLKKLNSVIECCGSCFRPFNLAETIQCPECGIEYHTECYGNAEYDPCIRCLSV